METKKTKHCKLALLTAVLLFCITSLFFHIDDASAASKKVGLNKTKVSVEIYDTYKLKMVGTNQKPTWSTSNKNIVSVSKNGTLTAKKIGKATVTAKIGKKKYNCKVTVTYATLKINKDSAKMRKKETRSFGVKYENNGIFGYLLFMGVKWSTSNKNVATVDQYGNVKAVGKGTCILTVESPNKNIQPGKCKITVLTKKLNTQKYKVEQISDAYSYIDTEYDGPDAWEGNCFGLHIITKDTNAKNLHWEIVNGDYAEYGGDAYMPDIGFLTPKDVGNELRRVKDGFLSLPFIHGMGKHKLNLCWYPDGYSKENKDDYHEVVASITVNIKDFKKIEDKWLDSVIKKVTTNAMTDKEKMTALCKYIRKTFKYLPNGEKGLYNMFSEYQPYFIKKTIDCIDATGIMMLFADKFGLKSEATYAGYLNHHFATVYFKDGTSEGYDASPYAGSGYIELKDIKKIV